MAASGLILDPRRSSRKDFQGLGRCGAAAPRQRRGSVPAARHGVEVGLWWRLRDGVLGSRGCGLGCLKGRRVSGRACPVKDEARSPVGIVGLPLRARGEGKGMTPTHGPGQAVRERGRRGWERRAGQRCWAAERAQGKEGDGCSRAAQGKGAGWAGAVCWARRGGVGRPVGLSAGKGRSAAGWA